MHEYTYITRATLLHATQVSDIYIHSYTHTDVLFTYMHAYAHTKLKTLVGHKLIDETRLTYIHTYTHTAYIHTMRTYTHIDRQKTQKADGQQTP
jgi:hypothetical protein